MLFGCHAEIQKILVFEISNPFDDSDEKVISESFLSTEGARHDLDLE